MTSLLLALHLATTPYTAGPHLTLPGHAPAPRERVTRTEIGGASVWTLEGAERDLGWSPTAWGQHRYDESGYLAAHRSAPRGQLMLVTNLGNGLSKHLLIADRGPAAIYDRETGEVRIIDVSPPVASELRMDGLCRVKVEWVR